YTTLFRSRIGLDRLIASRLTITTGSSTPPNDAIYKSPRTKSLIERFCPPCMSHLRARGTEWLQRFRGQVLGGARIVKFIEFDGGGLIGFVLRHVGKASVNSGLVDFFQPIVKRRHNQIVERRRPGFSRFDDLFSERVNWSRYANSGGVHFSTVIGIVLG